jgi:hypothetical protein
MNNKNELDYIVIPAVGDFVQLSNILKKFQSINDRHFVFTPPRIETEEDYEFNDVYELLKNLGVTPLVTEICVFDPLDRTQQRFFNLISGASESIIHKYINEMKVNVAAERERSESNQSRGAIIPKRALYEHLALWSFYEAVEREKEFKGEIGHSRFRSDGYFRGWGRERDESVDEEKVREYTKGFLNAFCANIEDEPQFPRSRQLFRFVVPFSRAGGRLIGETDTDAVFHKGGALICVASCQEKLEELTIVKFLSQLSRLLSDAVIRSSYFEVDYERAGSSGTLIATTGFSHQINKIASRVSEDWLVSFPRWQRLLDWNASKGNPIPHLVENAMVCPAPTIFSALESNLRIWSLTFDCSELFDQLPFTLEDIALQAIEYAKQRFRLIRAKNMKFNHQNEALVEILAFDPLEDRKINLEELHYFEFDERTTWEFVDPISYELNKVVSGCLRFFTGIFENFLDHSKSDAALTVHAHTFEEAIMVEDRTEYRKRLQLRFVTTGVSRSDKPRTALGLSGTAMLQYIADEFLRSVDCKRHHPEEVGDTYLEEIELTIGKILPLIDRRSEQ